MGKSGIVMNVNPAFVCQGGQLLGQQDIVFSAFLACGVGPGGSLSFMDLWKGARYCELMHVDELLKKFTGLVGRFSTVWSYEGTVTCIKRGIGINEDPLCSGRDVLVVQCLGFKPPLLG